MKRSQPHAVTHCPRLALGVRTRVHPTGAPWRVRGPPLDRESTWTLRSDPSTQRSKAARTRPARTRPAPLQGAPPGPCRSEGSLAQGEERARAIVKSRLPGSALHQQVRLAVLDGNELARRCEPDADATRSLTSLVMRAKPSRRAQSRTRSAAVSPPRARRRCARQTRARRAGPRRSRASPGRCRRRREHRAPPRGPGPCARRCPSRRPDLPRPSTAFWTCSTTRGVMRPMPK